MYNSETSPAESQRGQELPVAKEEDSWTCQQHAKLHIRMFLKAPDFAWAVLPAESAAGISNGC